MSYPLNNSGASQQRRSSSVRSTTDDATPIERGTAITQKAVGTRVTLNSSGIPQLVSHKLQKLVDLVHQNETASTASAISQAQQHTNNNNKQLQYQLSSQQFIGTPSPVVPELDQLTASVLNDINDEFTQTVSLFAAALARHRGAQCIDVQDIDLVLRMHYDMIVPATKPLLDAEILQQAKDDALLALQQQQTEARSQAAKAAIAAKQAAADAQDETKDGDAPVATPIVPSKSKVEPIDPKQVELTAQELIVKALSQSAAQRAARKPYLSDTHKRRMDLVVRARSAFQHLHNQKQQQQQQQDDDGSVIVDLSALPPRHSSVFSAASHRNSQPSVATTVNRNKRKRDDDAHTQSEASGEAKE